jgi:hypothetical protein
MHVMEDSTVGRAGDEAVTLLARRLSDAVRSTGNGRRNGNGNGGNGNHARRVALEVGAAMLANTSAGTAEHSNDVVLITEAIGQRMGVASADTADLLAAARLHDIGKTCVPTEILEKPGPLTGREWDVMRQHTVIGEQILSSVDELLGVARLVRHSHERWDGAGYPDGLARTEIPLGSRIIFCADAFHAIRCDRPYRAGRSAREAVAEILRCAGKQFDPEVAGALEEVVRERNARPRAMGGSARLFALLMCLAVGGAGSAVARSGLLPEPSPPPPAEAQSTPPPGCGTAACPTVALPVGGLSAVGGPGWVPGPRPLHPGLPGELHRAGKGHNHSGSRGKSEAAKHHQKAKGKALGKAKGAGHSAESHGLGGSGTAGRSAAPSSSSSSRSSSGGHSHHSSTHHSSGRRGASHGSSRGAAGGSSNAGGNGNGNGNAGGNSGTRGN